MLAGLGIVMALEASCAVRGLWGMGKLLAVGWFRG
jgi:hypothetical protein